MGHPPSDLFRGTAEYYRLYRPPYPAEMFQWIADRYNLDGTGRLLDGGCGTGAVCLPLSRWFSDVIGVDLDVDMIRTVRAAADEAGIANASFVCGPMELAVEQYKPLRMVTFGASFHWMDRVNLARQIFAALEPGGGMVLLAGSNIWRGDEPWKKVVHGAIKRWLGEERRAGSGIFKEGPTHEECLAKTPFQNIEKIDFPVANGWSRASLLGYLYSTSFASEAVLGDKKADFEADLVNCLDKVAPSGEFWDITEYSIISARKA